MTPEQHIARIRDWCHYCDDDHARESIRALADAYEALAEAARWVLNEAEIERPGRVVVSELYFDDLKNLLN